MGRQLSFYSALARPACVADLAGLLCAGGEAVRFGSGEAARLSVVLTEHRRAKALIAECARRGVELELGSAPDEAVTGDMAGDELLAMHTAFRADLAGLAADWLNGVAKSVPARLCLDGGTLRLWAIVAGRRAGTGYQFGLDSRAPHTHEPLGDALLAAGLPTSQVGPRAGGPALRVTGSRARNRLAELVGDPPMADEWPS